MRMGAITRVRTVGRTMTRATARPFHLYWANWQSMRLSRLCLRCSAMAWTSSTAPVSPAISESVRGSGRRRWSTRLTSRQTKKGSHDGAPEIADLTPVEAEGRRLYQEACAQCHAADGTGQNGIGRFLSPSPTDFGGSRFKSLMASGDFADRTLRAPAGTSMPSFEGVLSREQAEAIAAYVRRAFQAP